MHDFPLNKVYIKYDLHTNTSPPIPILCMKKHKFRMAWLEKYMKARAKCFWINSLVDKLLYK